MTELVVPAVHLLCRAFMMLTLHEVSEFRNSISTVFKNILQVDSCQHFG